METVRREAVLVSGCYDVVHGGHVEFFERARGFGNYLIVCIPGDEVMRRFKGRVTLPCDHKARLIGALECVDEVVVGNAAPAELNFAEHLHRVVPDFFVATEDDRWPKEKRALCEAVGTKYVQISRSPTWPEFSTAEMLRRSFFAEVPARVDLAGSWLDVPSLARPAGFVVNCTITPFAHPNGPYRPGAGIGGSAAFAVALGKPAIETELNSGVGWQDPAVIQETGLCVWQSGERPQLVLKNSGSLLQGKMLILDTGGKHATPDLVERQRDYNTLVTASQAAAEAVRDNDFGALCAAVEHTYEVQREEGMRLLLDVPECAARKYCGAGWGGYALYLFRDEIRRQTAMTWARRKRMTVLAVEPFLRTWF